MKVFFVKKKERKKNPLKWCFLLFGLKAFRCSFPIIITGRQFADSLAAEFAMTGQLPIESASLTSVISISKSPEFLSEQWLQEIARVLKPGGAILLQTSVPPNEQDEVFHTCHTLKMHYHIDKFVECRNVKMS